MVGTKAFVLTAEAGAARAGLLFGAHATPACLVLTRNGAVPHITPAQLNEILASVDEQTGADAGGAAGAGRRQLAHVCALDLWGKPGWEVMEAYAASSPAAGGLGSFCGLSPHWTFFSADRVGRWAYGGREVSAEHVTCSTSRGFLKITPAEYTRAAKASRPEAMDLLSDPLPASDMRAERVRKSVDRTLAWADAQIKQMAQLGAAPAAVPEDSEEPPAKRAAVSAAGAPARPSAQAAAAPYMFGAVQGGGLEKERVRCAAALSALPELCGFALGGFGTGESPSDRDRLIRATVAALVPDKPRLISGVGSPEEVLRCVAAGVDLFSTDYPFTLAMNGCALVFDIDPLEAAPLASEGGNGSRSPLCQRADVNLHDACFAEDGSKLTPGSCMEDSRAYIHHLLLTHELLGFILLAMHNLHHYLSFFAMVRKHVRNGTLEAYTEAVLSRLAAQEATAPE
jgi:queuine/archaeosine tRNA-ribosyltransferase